MTISMEMTAAGARWACADETMLLGLTVLVNELYGAAMAEFKALCRYWLGYLGTNPTSSDSTWRCERTRCEASFGE